MYYCGTGAASNKFFNNNFTTILLTSSNCVVEVYDNLNLKTVGTDSNPFSGVEVKLNDTSSTFYRTQHWGGTDSVTFTGGYISTGTLTRSGSYISSSTFTNNTITCSLSLIHI